MGSRFKVQGLGMMAALSAILLTGSCKSKEQTTVRPTETTTSATTTATEGPAILATIERTSCFGSCPIYKATFFDNGEVMYVGRNFVTNIGTYTTLISAEELQGIRTMAEDVGYFLLEDAYPTPISDFPKCITSVQMDGKKKSVLNGENAPRDLIGLERHLDGLLKEREWVKVSDVSRY